MIRLYHHRISFIVKQVIKQVPKAIMYQMKVKTLQAALGIVEVLQEEVHM